MEDNAVLDTLGSSAKEGKISILDSNEYAWGIIRFLGESKHHHYQE
jgi:hypothetical protein